ncbi:protein angel homolog 2 isoform X2 [Betta splendens]|uniref:Protein angel homolog 2 isoform X2 n=1 Tax=Betta splendens TaxID=158456 RepID=A0A6P7LQL6_BETSP|nr:protein angel homolog 2 isoform X2 [Betta splendens]
MRILCRDVNDVSPNGEQSPMFLNRLSGFGSSVLPVLSRDGFKRSTHIPAPPPWWSERRHRLYIQTVVTRTLHPQNMNPGSFSSRCGSVHTASGLMTEHGDKEPVHKRRKSTEVQSAEEREGRGAAAQGSTAAKVSEGRRDHHHPSSSHKPHSHHNSRDMNEERTKYWNKAQKDTTPPRGRSKYQTGGSRTPRFTARDLGVEWEHHRPPDAPKETSPGHFDRTRLGGDAHMQPSPPGDTLRPQDAAQTTPVKPLHRQWLMSPACSSSLQPPGVCTAFDFVVMSYNILSQELLQDNAYLYRHCNPSVLPWDYRLPNLLSEIQQHNADILCLQEVQEDHYENQIKPALQKQGYSSKYKKRTGGKPDGCAVFYKSSRLSLVSSTPVEFFRSGDDLLDRDNVGLVVLLKPNDAAGQSGSICVANTHLLFNPRRGDIKLAQLAILLAEISRLSRLPDGSAAPVVLCGDFNATPWSPLLSFLTEGYLDYRGLLLSMVSGQQSPPRGQRRLGSPLWSPSLGINCLCQYEATPPGGNSDQPAQGQAGAAAADRAKLEHGLKLASSYQRHRMPDGRREITTCHYQSAKMVDYILFTSDLSSTSSPPGRGLQLLGRLSLVGESELQAVNGLPNQHHSSDHLPLLARFLLRM